MKKEDVSKRFTAAFKIEAVQRIAAEGPMWRSCRENSGSRKALYDWRKQFHARSPTGFSRRDSPPPPRQQKTRGQEDGVSVLPSTPEALPC